VRYIARLFSPSSLWNTRKTGLTFVAAANGVLSSDSFGINDGAYDHPTYFASATDPMTTFQLRGSYGNPSTTITQRAPAGMQAASGSDGVLTVLLTDGTLLDMYGASVHGSSVTAYAYAETDGVNGPGFGDQSNYHVAGTTAIGSPQGAGTILARDISAGVIPHALSIAFDYSQLGGAGDGAGDAVPPAVANDDGGGPGPLPEGGLLVIPPGTPKPAGLSKAGSELWVAAQTYGVYITDQLGGNPRFYSDGSATVSNAFGDNDFTIVGRALRLAKTW
jgi:hypothetical protein